MSEWRCRCGANNALAWATCENCGQSRPASVVKVASPAKVAPSFSEAPPELVRSIAAHVAGLFEAPRSSRRDRHRRWLEDMGWTDEVVAWDQWLARREARRERR